MARRGWRDLDLRESSTTLKGGERGPAIVPGKADESLLYKAVKRDGELQMPPGKTALTAAEVATLRDWINAGARFERGTEDGRAFVVVVQEAGASCGSRGEGCLLGSQSDRRVYSCEARRKGLAACARSRPSHAGSRAYFDLHGLPPTPEQVDQFVNDKSPDAYEKLIDRLLASPRYGERWGRYWLDLVRYADTSGFETDHFFTTAWRYRDWVIESFNSDKPYNTFVQEQIAADEIWSMNMDLEGTSSCRKKRRRT